MAGAAGLGACAHVGGSGFTPTETMMWATYPLASDTTIGTCFLVAMKDPGAPGGHVPVVVTSAHALEGARGKPLYLPLRMLDAERNLSFAIIEIGGAGGKFYVKHPRLDVAAFELEVPPDLPMPIFLMFLEEGDFVTGEADRSRAGEEVSFVGFPEGFPGTPDLFPVLRGGRIASYDPSEPAAPGFLVNGDVYPGDSGAPVFDASNKGRPKLLGVVVQRIELDHDEISPLALAVNAQVIKETLRLLAKQRRAGP
jgi:hypothetical protein